MGALLTVRLPEKLGKEMTTKMEKIIFWSYSTTVLHLICQKSSTYKAFVGNRVSEQSGDHTKGGQSELEERGKDLYSAQRRR